MLYADSPESKYLIHRDCVTYSTFNIIKQSAFVFTRLSEVNQYLGGGGGGSSKNKSELHSHFSSSFVCFSYTNGNLGGGA